VNLRLRHIISSKTIQSYRHHIVEYLKSSIILFDHCSLAPNHHMSVHIADCMDRFGPVRAYLKKKLLGEIKRTFLQTFCRLGNIRSIATSLGINFPKHCSENLQLFLEPAQNNSVNHTGDTDSLTLADLDALVACLNAKSSHPVWLHALEWTNLDNDIKCSYSPVASQVKFMSNFCDGRRQFSTFFPNQNNGIVALEESLTNSARFGRIKAIFSHSRTNLLKETCVDTWVKFLPFSPLSNSCMSFNPFASLEDFHLNTSLALQQTQKACIINAKEVLAQCAWIEFGAKELSAKIKSPTIAFVAILQQ
ncbi:hypothetical protein PPACK8108_LOCUS651, partial [Phakopsora pachyrhizi]